MHNEVTKDTKRKAKPSIQHWSRLKILMAIAVSILGGMCLGLILLQQRLWSGYVKTSLDAEYILTAEYLLANPQPTPEGNSISVHIGEEICILVSIYDDNDRLITTWLNSEILINRQRVGYGDIEEHVTYSIIGSVEVFCIENTLESGIHLIEFRARGNWRRLLFSHQWAIEVE